MLLCPCKIAFQTTARQSLAHTRVLQCVCEAPCSGVLMSEFHEKPPPRDNSETTWRWLRLGVLFAGSRLSVGLRRK